MPQCWKQRIGMGLDVGWELIFRLPEDVMWDFDMDSVTTDLKLAAKIDDLLSRDVVFDHLIVDY